VIASDLREQNPLLEGTGPYVSMDVMNKEMLHVQVIRQNITQIYLLAAILSATGEKNPNLAWHLNMQGLLNVLDIAREENIHKVYWPSSIAVFGPLLSLLRYMASVNMQVSSGAITISSVLGWM
jgi:nucleoside-diphosphate-sugar epimerase